MTTKPLILGTRGSDLALAQTKLVADSLGEEVIEVRVVETTADKGKHLSLQQLHSMGLDKGVFTKELEESLLAQDIDVAVHSLKDLPTQQHPDLTLSAVLPAAACHDVLIAKKPIHYPSIPEGTRIGTSSVRRQRQLLWACPDVVVSEMRGNVPTRLRKLSQREELDAIVLAQAGLDRLGFCCEERLDFEEHHFYVQALPPEQFKPAAGQGIVVLQTRRGDERAASLLAKINDQDTFKKAIVQRTFLRMLGGGCQTPIGVHLREEEKGVWNFSAILFDQAHPHPPRRGEARGRIEEGDGLAKKLLSALYE